ncbi:hypothetical protein ABHJ46_004147 [Shigella dysenteriae]|uniref:hypothetical protein n=1 Tax=Escherichia coli TaxID=562 RepID=UPI0018321A37|nr:hypothetical protein [Escherichia coli]EFP6909393.1 hypothetical protein [Shigella dysenteriae]EFM6337425.1 hypothetical protein [Escherichia coli]EFP7035438.1 hypothetical protein [Shigella dysenteriae]ELQ3667734.1 hypothetical protein [Escherichia coli]MCX3827963.1 hypothetical protein [Escherichia coli]
MLQFIFIFISSVSLAINISVTNQFDFSTKNNSNLIKQDMVFDFIDLNIKQCIYNKDCRYNSLPFEKFYSLKIKKCNITTDNKNIFILYTVPSLSVYVPLNNSSQDNAIINYQALDKKIKQKCFRSPQDDNLVLGMVSK